MTEKQAVQEGLRFTGTYERCFKLDEVKAKAAEIRKQGFRAVVVPEKANRYSRGQNTGITGYSVYAELKFFEHRELTNLQAHLNSYSERRARIDAEYKAKVDALDAEFKSIRERVAELSK